MRKFTNLVLSRRMVTILLIIIQAIILLVLINSFSHVFTYIYIFFILLSIIMVLYLINKETSPSLKLPWLVIMMLIPLFGGALYLLFGQNHVSKALKKENNKLYALRNSASYSDQETFKQLQIDFPHYIGQVNYLRNYSNARVYAHTKTTYFPLGENMFEAMCEKMKQAKKYIFIESFIVDEGYMLQTVLDILIDKVKEGVEVRFIYDDLGCLTTLPPEYFRYLRSHGIKAMAFNPFEPILSIVHNNRDHRKITVIDGEIAFNGGINIADEYINKIRRFGHWKDNAVMLEGEGVNDFTLMFLETWNYYMDEDEDFSVFLYDKESLPIDNGYVQCYEDSPLDYELVGENVYLNIINQANHYVYITTPYLIIDNDLMIALCNAAKRGVDVRIIMPFIPDKWYVHLIGQASYDQLLKAGVKIYEYTPGFIHAKTFISDDHVATVGTINLDYRSLVHHFECGTYMLGTSAVCDIKKDYYETLEVSQPVFIGYFKSKPWYLRIIAVFLKLFAPLM
ncbi:MAG: cardiolipin synthase [Beduini sp.]|uniref:cardiolipin synthase n=1 Tax=Beduini sp. TaxID=1922300 RepID=UPI0011CC7CF5